MHPRIIDCDLGSEAKYSSDRMHSPLSDPIPLELQPYSLCRRKRRWEIDSVQDSSKYKKRKLFLGDRV
jgi:hypothetical protein